MWLDLWTTWLIHEKITFHDQHLPNKPSHCWARKTWRQLQWWLLNYSYTYHHTTADETLHCYGATKSTAPEASKPMSLRVTSQQQQRQWCHTTTVSKINLLSTHLTMTSMLVASDWQQLSITKHAIYANYTNALYSLLASALTVVIVTYITATINT